MSFFVQKLKGVMKTKSSGEGGMMMSMGKALIARNFTPTKQQQQQQQLGVSPARPAESIADIFAGKEGNMVPNKHRAFLMDTQVKYTIVSIVIFG
jgi:hypothetical protein